MSAHHSKDIDRNPSLDHLFGTGGLPARPDCLNRGGRYRRLNTQYGSIAVAEDKARSALYFRRPSKVFEELVAQGGMNLRLLALRGASPLEGGIPLTQDGKIVGAIGVSGATSVQDGQVAKAGADALK